VHTETYTPHSGTWISETVTDSQRKQKKALIFIFVRSCVCVCVRESVFVSGRHTWSGGSWGSDEADAEGRRKKVM
jgi:hypothetical protein